MRDAEGVVDVGVVVVDQLLHEGRVVGRLAGSKRRFSRSSTWGASRASSSRTGPRSSGDPEPPGSPEVGAAGDTGPTVAQVLDGGEGGVDPEVVGHLGWTRRARPQRNVEADADEHTRPVEVGQVTQQRQPPKQWIVCGCGHLSVLPPPVRLRPQRPR